MVLAWLMVPCGRHRAIFEITRAERRRRTKWSSESTEKGAIAGALGGGIGKGCAEPDIPVNDNDGPPRFDYSDNDRTAMLEGVIQNMVTPIELIRAVDGGMQERKFCRIVNVTSMSVVMPIEDLDLSSGARAGLISLLAGICRQIAPDGVTINNFLPGNLDTDRLRLGI